jgi:putative thioredoxin
MAVIEVTDVDFEEKVLNESKSIPVVMDMWAPWCGPCKLLGPILEKTVDFFQDQVTLAKINVDENPSISSVFQVQSIPAVYAIFDRKVIDTFIGAKPENEVFDFIANVIAKTKPSEADLLVQKGDEASLREALELEPDHRGAIVALAKMMLDNDNPEETLALLVRIPETEETRHLMALARVARLGNNRTPITDNSSVYKQLEELLDKVKTSEPARHTYLDLLEVLEASDPLREEYRRKLASRLF